MPRVRSGAGGRGPEPGGGASCGLGELASLTFPVATAADELPQASFGVRRRLQGWLTLPIAGRSAASRGARRPGSRCTLTCAPGRRPRRPLAWGRRARAIRELAKQCGLHLAPQQGHPVGRASGLHAIALAAEHHLDGEAGRAALVIGRPGAGLVAGERRLGQQRSGGDGGVRDLDALDQRDRADVPEVLPLIRMAVLSAASEGLVLRVRNDFTVVFETLVYADSRCTVGDLRR